MPLINAFFCRKGIDYLKNKKLQIKTKRNKVLLGKGRYLIKTVC